MRYGSGEMFWMTCPWWPWPKSRLRHWLTKFCLSDKVKTSDGITTKLGTYIPLVMLIIWIDFGEILLETFFSEFEIKKCFVKVTQDQTLYWPYSQNGWSAWHGMKRKYISWILDVILTFDLTHDPDLGFFKVKFQNSCISGIFGLIDVKRKGNLLDIGPTIYMTLPFDHTHDLNLEVWRWKFEIGLFQEWKDLLT